jgi:hypothetical protein
MLTLNTNNAMASCRIAVKHSQSFLETPSLQYYQRQGILRHSYIDSGNGGRINGIFSLCFLLAVCQP